MLHQIKKFRLLDDDFMTKCFENNKEATELVLGIILKNPDIRETNVQTQYNMKNIKGCSLRLDIYATDLEGKKYSIEIQRAHARRRFDEAVKALPKESQKGTLACLALRQIQSEQALQGLQ